MSEAQNTLFSYDDAEAPRITEHKPVYKHTDSDVILGVLGLVDNRDGQKCMVVRRTRHGDEPGEKQDYFRKVGGYSMTKVAVAALQRHDVERVFIEETDNDRVIEYEVAAFPRDGADVPDVNGVEQFCCPVDAALRLWDRSDVSIDYVWKEGR